MTAAASTIIDAALYHLNTGQRETRNTLSGSYTAGGTSLTFTYDLGQLREGSRLGIEQEHFYVYAADGTAKTATVAGAQDGTTAANHASGAVVFVNPRATRFEVLRAVNDELNSLSTPRRGLYKVSTVDLTYQPAFQGYNLTAVTAIEDILEVRAQRHGGDKAWDTLGTRQYQLQRNASTTDFASGFSLQLLQGDSGRTVRVVYRAPFGAISTEADDVTGASVGFPATATDILAIGAAIRIAWPREIRRNQTENQGDTRRPDEVPPGAQLNAVRGLVTQYEQRIAEEAGRLMRKYPIRRYA